MTQKKSKAKHWADKYADEVMKRKKKKTYVVESLITPSGIIHIGNVREIMTQYYVYKTLKERTNAVFQHMWDDYDRFRKVPKQVSREYERYIGMPVSDVPDPDGCHKSYARHFLEPLEKELESIGVTPKYFYQSEEYRKCRYSEQIKIALEKAKTIRTILNKFRKEPLEETWLPAIVYCEKCKHETSIISFESYTVTYKCICGHQNTFDFRKKGIVKLRWRVDWPARWHHFDVDFESSGKDHQAAGGSWDTGVLISKQVYSQEPPIGPMYEFIYLKGQKEKMSSSIGNVATISNLLEIYEPEVIRYMYSCKVNKAFDISFDETLINTYNQFDKAVDAYYNKGDENEAKRFEISMFGSKKIPPKFIPVPFLVCANTIQITQGDKQKAAKILQKTGHVEKVHEHLLRRLGLADTWTQKYAPDSMKFIVQEKIPRVVLSKEIKEIFAEAAALIEKGKSGDEVQQFIYNTANEKKIPQGKVFTAAYQLLLNKNRGPRLGPLLVLLDKDFVVKRLQLKK